MKTEILRLLKESEGYLSGQQLCEQFQVSRTAVWKCIEQLKKEGYQIEAVRNKGYRLMESPDVIDGREIQSLLHTSWAGKPLYYYEETDSTNTRAKADGEKGAPHGALYVADKQVTGKGRRGRIWQSPSGTSVYMTILLRPKMEPVKAPQITLLMALAAVDAIRKTLGLEAGIKWPNDVVIDGKKVCGILTEMSSEPDLINYVVVGIGTNVNQDTFPEELKEKATSLKLEAGEKVNRSQIAAAIIENFERYYDIFARTEDLSELQETYNQVLVNREREVLVLEPGHEYEAYALGINEKGELIVRTGNGEEKHVFAGEVSVRGIYGYI